MIFLLLTQHSIFKEHMWSSYIMYNIDILCAFKYIYFYQNRKVSCFFNELCFKAILLISLLFNISYIMEETKLALDISIAFYQYILFLFGWYHNSESLSYYQYIFCVNQPFTTYDYGTVALAF